MSILTFLQNPAVQLKIVQALVPLFLTILFLQSGLDKVLNFRGNLDYFTSHFAKSPLRKFTKLLLIKITALEILTGILCAAGIFCLFCCDSKQIVFWGEIFAALTLTALFLGQRLAQDYAGAAVLAAYMAVVLIGLKLLL